MEKSRRAIPRPPVNTTHPGLPLWTRRAVLGPSQEHLHCLAMQHFRALTSPDGCPVCRHSPPGLSPPEGFEQYDANVPGIFRSPAQQPQG